MESTQSTGQQRVWKKLAAPAFAQEKKLVLQVRASVV
jgi:hypothetical protein